MDRPGDQRALLWVDEHGARTELTFREVRDVSDRVAQGLTSLGIKAGDRVLVVIPRCLTGGSR
jgi:acetyl-CoA synthetase